MQKLPLLLMASSLFLINVSAASIEPTVTVEDSQPRPSEPGDTVKLFVTVANDGGAAGSFQPLEVETVENIRFLGTTSDFGESFRLCGGCQKVGTLYFKVDPAAESGTYPIDLELGSGNKGVVEKYELTVDGSPELSVNAKNFTAVPGQSSRMILELENIGTETAGNVKIEAESDRIDFQPSSTGVGDIGTGEILRQEFHMKVEKETGSGLEESTFEISYRDGSEKISKEFDRKAEILQEAKLATGDITTGDPVIGKKNSVIVELENLGPGKAEQIVASLECENAEINTGKSFVGQLDEEESVPASFELTPQGGDVSCTLRTSYSDEKRNQLRQEFSFSASERSNNVLPIVGILVLLLIAAFYWKKRRDDELEEI